VIAPTFALLIRFEGYLEFSLLPRFDSTVVDQVALLDLRYFLVDSGLTDSYRGLRYQCGRLLLLSSIRCTATRVAVRVQVRHEISESCELFIRVSLSSGSSHNLSDYDCRSVNETFQSNNSIQESLVDLLNRVIIDWLVDINLSNRLLDWQLIHCWLYRRLTHYGFHWQLV
jgi:hypothetical protein